MNGFRAVRHHTTADFSNWSSSKRLQQGIQSSSCLQSLNSAFLPNPAGKMDPALRHDSMDSSYVNMMLVRFLFWSKELKGSSKGKSGHEQGLERKEVH